MSRKGPQMVEREYQKYKAEKVGDQWGWYEDLEEPPKPPEPLYKTLVIKSFDDQHVITKQQIKAMSVRDGLYEAEWTFYV